MLIILFHYFSKHWLLRHPYCFFMILIIANFKMINRWHLIFILNNVFNCCFDAVRNPLRPLPPPCLSQIALGRGALIMILKYYNTTQLHFDYDKLMLPHALGPLARRILWVHFALFLHFHAFWLPMTCSSLVCHVFVHLFIVRACRCWTVSLF